MRPSLIIVVLVSCVHRAPAPVAEQRCLAPADREASARVVPLARAQGLPDFEVVCFVGVLISSVPRCPECPEGQKCEQCLPERALFGGDGVAGVAQVRLPQACDALPTGSRVVLCGSWTGDEGAGRVFLPMELFAPAP